MTEKPEDAAAAIARIHAALDRLSDQITELTDHLDRSIERYKRLTKPAEPRPSADAAHPKRKEGEQGR